ncbi:protein of unknown function DUF4050 [Canna indica]|uniref:Gag1-like clamp domain-containing protein n=1 Tax=Canna indica TaxID=4628 RepID=A0AAQ3JPR1_9LILI|nr:protein of unknown function DUF4050 [Canna indica]
MGKDGSNKERREEKKMASATYEVVSHTSVVFLHVSLVVTALDELVDDINPPARVVPNREMHRTGPDHIAPTSGTRNQNNEIRDSDCWAQLEPKKEESSGGALRPITESGSRGCLECCTKPAPTIAVDEPSRGLKIQGRTVKKPTISEEFWSTSTHEMENSGVQSQRSISSISTLAQTFDHHGGVGSTSNSLEFVNHGLDLWNQTRQQWTGNKRPKTLPQQVPEPRLSWNATYDSLLGSNKPFPQPIPLSEMIDFLVDVWEQEGLYD